MSSRQIQNQPSLMEAFQPDKMQGEILLLYYGMMSREVREHLMAALKINLNNSASVPQKFRKRAFSIADECITNIYQYYYSTHIESSMTGISVCVQNNTAEFIFSNTVKHNHRENLEKHLAEVYHRPPEILKKNFTDSLNEPLTDSSDKAGLGLIIVSQRTLGNFDFHFEEQFDGNYLFHLKITLDLQ